MIMVDIVGEMYPYGQVNDLLARVNAAAGAGREARRTVVLLYGVYVSAMTPSTGGVAGCDCSSTQAKVGIVVPKLRRLHKRLIVLQQAARMRCGRPRAEVQQECLGEEIRSASAAASPSEGVEVVV
jgi:hypothetical protein